MCTLGSRAPVVDCFVATCADVPDLDPDDRILLEALQARGLRAKTAVWNDGSVDWTLARMCLLRATWDYPKRHHEFAAWLEAVAAATVVRNAPSIVRWNAHKRYLQDLEREGVRVVPTLWIARGQQTNVADRLAGLGWSEAVVKPAVGSAALDVLRVSLAELDGAQQHVDRLVSRQDVLVQPYIAAGEAAAERSLVYIDGAFSHAVSKRFTFDTNLRIVGAADATEATRMERELADRAMAAVPHEQPLYGRVDLFQDANGTLFVNELELIEPALYFGINPFAATRLANAIARELVD
jgi:glutathione synthase/RimK-type ligase-like ATP-grasp enzyme